MCCWSVQLTWAPVSTCARIASGSSSGWSATVSTWTSAAGDYERLWISTALIDEIIIMSSLPSLYMSPSSISSLTEAKEGFCISQGGSSSGNVAILGATGFRDFKFLERFDVTRVKSSLCRELLPAEDNPPIGVPLVVPQLLGLTFDARRRCNEFSGGRRENPNHCCHCRIPRHQNSRGP